MDFKLNALIFCDDAILSSDKKKLELRGIFDEIYTQGFPAIQSKFVIFLNFTMTPGYHREYFEIKQGDHVILKSTERDVTTGEKHQFTHHVENMHYFEPGKYDVVIYMDGQQVAKNYFEVKLDA